MVGLYSGLWLWLRGNDYSVSIFNAATAWHRYNRVMDQPQSNPPAPVLDKRNKDYFSPHLWNGSTKELLKDNQSVHLKSCVFVTHIIKIKITKQNYIHLTFWVNKLHHRLGNFLEESSREYLIVNSVLLQGPYWQRSYPACPITGLVQQCWFCASSRFIFG